MRFHDRWVLIDTMLFVFGQSKYKLIYILLKKKEQAAASICLASRGNSGLK
jgi:hypothetical protein